VENGKPPLEPALRALAARRRRELGLHPDPETLAAYHEGELAGAEAERLRDHLALCPDCTQLLLDLGGFAALAPPAGVRGLTDGEVEGAWQAVRSQLAETEEAPPPSNLLRLPPPLSSQKGRPSRPAYLAWALAASWVAVVGLALWVTALRRDNAVLARPAVNVAIADLAARGDTTRGERSDLRALPAGDRLLLILDATDLPVRSGYEAEIADDRAAGPALWTGRGLVRSGENNFTLELPPRFLPPGKYQVRLFGLEAGQRQRLADFPLKIGAP